MQLKTSIHLEPYQFTVDHQQDIFSIGSCFAQIMGSKLDDAKFKILNNPFGTIYNPLSIIQLLKFSLDLQLPEDSSYLLNQGLHYNYHMHGDLSDLSREKLQDKIEEAIAKANQQLKEAHWLIITLGTAFVYERIANNTIVANCHRVPAKEFNRKMLQVSTITRAFDDFLPKLKTINPEIRLIVTVSPVRHVRDGMPQNSVSKATLRLACQHLITNYDFIDYFPSYEFMLDDLRDYRFYADDMLHPSRMAEEYIWQNFQQRYMNEATRQLINEWNKIRQALLHRPFHPHTKEHQQFIKKTIEKLQRFKHKLDVTNELETLKEQLI